MCAKDSENKRVCVVAGKVYRAFEYFLYEQTTIEFHVVS